MNLSPYTLVTCVPGVIGAFGAVLVACSSNSPAEGGGESGTDSQSGTETTSSTHSGTSTQSVSTGQTGDTQSSSSTPGSGTTTTASSSEPTGSSTSTASTSASSKSTSTTTTTTTTSHSSSSTSSSSTCAVTGTSMSFATVYSTVMQGTCTGHHAGADPSGGLDMSTEMKAFTNLTGGTSAESGCGEHYVVPCNATGSLLYQKVSGTGIGASCGQRMPLGGPYLDATMITMIQSWINQGAAP
jgi:hypothetical protein